MAQYRAIFQNAYFKGLATAAVVTMGLAAGQAQAGALEASGLANASGDVIITGEQNDSGTDNKWESLTVSGTNLELKHNLTINAGNSNVITANGGTATFTGKDLTIDITDAKNKATHGLTINAAKAQSGTKAEFNNVTIKQGLLSINAADSADAGKVEGKVITIGSAPKADAKAAPATPNAYVALGKSGSIGIEMSNSGDLSSFTSLTINADGQLKAVSGDSVTNTIHAAKLKIAGGELLVDASDAGSGSSTTINLANGEMTGGKVTVKSGGSLALNFVTHKITDGTAELGKKFTATDGNIALGADLTVSGDGGLVVDGAKVYATTAAKGVKLEGNARYQTSLADLKGLLDGGDTYAQGAKSGSILITSGTLDITDSEEVDLTKLKFSSGDAGVAGTIVTSKKANQATLEINNAKIAGALTGADKLAVVANQLTLGGSAPAGVESLKAKDVTFESTPHNQPYTLQDALTLSSTTKVDNKIKAASGSFNSDVEGVLVSGGSAKLIIDGGIYAADKIGVKKGSLTVSNTEADLSKLSIGTLSLDNTGGADNTITVSGAAEKEAVLDLSETNLTLIGDDSEKTIITVNEHGTLLVSGENLM